MKILKVVTNPRHAEFELNELAQQGFAVDRKSWVARKGDDEVRVDIIRNQQEAHHYAGMTFDWVLFDDPFVLEPWAREFMLSRVRSPK